VHRKTLVLALLVSALTFAACDRDSSNSPTAPADLDTPTELNKFGSRWSDAAAFGPGVRSYEIVIENLTPDTGDGGSQVFSPPVVATHSPSMHLFRVGRYASDELAGLAEDALNGPVVAALNGSRRVFDVVEGNGAIPPGGSESYQIRASLRARRVSMAFMLVNTNDGFSGLESVRLPQHGERVMMVHAYDAGSEENTELYGDIPGPCCGNPGVRVPTRERIAHHEGITGGGDLDPGKWGWEGPVARITIRALAPAYELTLSNHTPNNGGGASQVFSPPVMATHGRSVRMFKVGRLASEELAGIAEDAMNQPMVDLLEASRGVAAVEVGGDVVPPGSSDSYVIEGRPGRDRLSMVFMLVNTNDGFAGVDAIRLPWRGAREIELHAYDAGSEANTELLAHIPGPCCGNPGVRVPTSEPIAHHLGITGDGDLDPTTWGWSGAVATLRIERVR